MNKRIKYSFTFQHDQSDCGIACLQSVIKYYGGNVSAEQLRQLSGTNKEGTSLLGLYQAANQTGFEADGCIGDIENLVQQKEPVILHVLKENIIQHFVVFYGIERDKIIIGDPASGIKQYSYAELDKIWRSKYCLFLKPIKEFPKTNSKKQKRKWFFTLIKPDYNILVSGVLIGILLSVFNLATAFATQKLIDNIIPSKNISSLFVVVGFLLFLLFVGTSLSYLRGVLSIKQNRNFNNRIIAYFYKSLVDLPKPFFDTRAIGDMIARLNDTSRIQNFISQLIGNCAIDVIMLVASVVFVFHYSSTIGIFIRHYID